MQVQDKASVIFPTDFAIFFFQDIGKELII